MNFIKTYIIISVLFFSSLLYSQVRFAGNTYNIIAADKNTEKTYFENWTDFDFIYKKFQIGLRFEAHKPPLPYSLDTTGYGISQRYLNYFSDNFQVTVGNFYTMLGRGLVLRSFENRGIRWDTNIDGINLNFQTTYINGKIISGKPRDRSGLRLTRLDGGEITFKPFDLFHIGSTYLNTKNDDNKSLQRGSVYTNFNLPFLSLYAEYAGRQDADLDWGNGHALYLSGDIFINTITLRAEYKDYENYHLYKNSLYDYNNPPTVIREHLYTLLNRHQHIINLQNEKGWLFETNIPLKDFGMATLNYNRTNNQVGEKLFEESYGQFEFFYPADWDWVFVTGHEQDREARYMNFVFSAGYNIDFVNSLKFIYEHQHVKISLTDRQFYSQIYHLEYSRSPYFTLSLIAEKTTEQYSERKLWTGIQGDIVFGRYDISIFGGTRRGGKMCAGGVCVYKPEFEGLEAIIQIRL